MLPAPRQPRQPAEIILGAIIAGALAVVLGGGLIVELAAVFAGHAGPHVTTSLIQHGVFGWHLHPGDPRLAFAEPLRSQLPGPVGMYIAVAIVAALLAALVAVGIWMLGRRPTAMERDRQGRHRQALTGPKQLARLFPSSPNGGLAVAAPVAGGRPIVVPHERSVGAIMAPHWGKSSAAVSYILDAPGAVLATSSKRELLLATATMRERMTGQPTLAFDPLGFCGWDASVRWSPVQGCEKPEVAMRRADAMMSVTTADGAANNAFWRLAGTILLRCALHASALDGADLADLRRWVAEPSNPGLRRVLETSGPAQAWLHDLDLMTRQQTETIDAAALLAGVALDCLALPQVAQVCSPSPNDAFDPARWISSGGTMHVVAPAAESTSVASLTAALVDEVVVAGRSQAMTAPGGRLDPVLRLVLDELPNICPLPKVDSYLADGAGRGMQILWSAQARSQLDRQFGRERTTTIMGATSVMLYGGGLNDPELLKDVSSLLGHVSIRERLTSTDRFGYRSWGEMVVKVPAVDPADIYSLAPFQAVMMTGGSTGSMVRLMPWWERRDAADIETAIKEARARCRI